MPTFYFDYDMQGIVTLDDEGIELTGQIAAQQLAIESLGQAIIDDSTQLSSGRLAIEVRDRSGPPYCVSLPRCLSKICETSHRLNDRRDTQIVMRSKTFAPPNLADRRG